MAVITSSIEARDAVASTIVQTDHLDDAGRALAALDLDHHAIMHPQTVGRYILGFGDADAAAQS